MKNKGFTLIELLAVIVILAIIALIAVPIVLNIINDSRESANKRSIELYGKAVENAVMKEQIKGEVLPDGTYSLNTTTGKVCHSEQATKCITPEVNGTKPTSYTMTITNGEITGQTIQLKSGQPSYTKTGNGSWTEVESSNNNEEPEPAQDIYAYLTYTGSDVNGPSINGDASSLSTSAPSDKNYYLKYKLDDDNKVTNSYACAIFDGEEYCVEGGSEDYYGWDTDAAHSTGNVKILYDIQSANITGVSCGFDSAHSYCYVGSVNLSADPNGDVYASDDVPHCVAYGDGSSSCDF